MGLSRTELVHLFRSFVPVGTQLLLHGQPTRPKLQERVAACSAQESPRGPGRAESRSGRERDPEPPNVKFLVLEIKEMAEIAQKLHKLHYGIGTKREALMEGALGKILDRLHTEETGMIAAGDKFRRGWAGAAFDKLPDYHAMGHPIRGNSPKDGN